MIKCTCGSPECSAQIRLETNQDFIGLWFAQAKDKEVLMYLDANAVIALIHELQDRVLQLATGEKRVRGL